MHVLDYISALIKLGASIFFAGYTIVQLVMRALGA